MSLPVIQLRHYRAELLTEWYLLTGEIEPFGPLGAYLNDANRVNVMLKNVLAAALDAGNVMDTFQAAELLVVRDEIVAIHLLDPVSGSTVQLLPRKEKLLVFAGRLVVQALFHCGPDTGPHDIFEATPGRWAACSEARVHPLLPFKRPIFGEAKLLLINKRHIQFYQPLGA